MAITFDEVLGLGLSKVSAQPLKVPEEVKMLMQKREELRAEKKYEEADAVREKIEKLGYYINDGSQGSDIQKNDD